MPDSKGGLRTVAYILVIIGGLVWGLVGLFNFNVVNAVLGSIPLLERLVYVLVGLAAVLLIIPETKGGAKKKEEKPAEPAAPPQPPREPMPPPSGTQV